MNTHWHHTLHRPPPQRGFTLVEAALALLAVGVVIGGGIVAANRQAADHSADRSRMTDLAFTDEVLVQMFDYAKRNHRLPCPDVNGDGFEDATSGQCTAGIRTGGVPYYTLGMQIPSPVGTGRDVSFAYSVYRGGQSESTDSDLTRALERSKPTAHSLGHASYSNLDDFKQALINAMTETNGAVIKTQPYVTGDGAQTGATHCDANPVTNVAFVLALAGSRNADQQGSDFDSVNLLGNGWNKSSKWDSAKTSTCFAGPGKSESATYDDKVKAVSFIELLGVLNR